MQRLQRSAITTARTARFQLARQTRRYAHDAHDDAHDDAHADGHDAHPHPVNESFGLGTWIAIGAIPAFMIVYKLSRPDVDGYPAWLTRKLDAWRESRELKARRNDIHTRMIEAAAQDKNLFTNSRPDRTYEMKFPEMANGGSPWNVPAGHTADMSKLIRHYEEKNWAAQEKRLAALLADQVPYEQPYTPIRRPPINL